MDKLVTPWKFMQLSISASFDIFILQLAFLGII